MLTSSFPRIDLILWALSTLLTLLLFCWILAVPKRALFPLFAAYLGTNLLQTVLQVIVYRRYGAKAVFPYTLVWSSQAVVVTARALAAAEFCRRVLGRFRGVWGLAWRILLFGAAGVLAAAVYFGKDGMRLAAMTLDIGSEAFVATLAAGTFLFVRYYDVPMEWSEKLFGLGLGAYSSLKIVNDLVLTRFLHSYANVWNAVSMVAFVGAAALWMTAFSLKSEAREPTLELRSDDSDYRALIPAINERLWDLNRQLIHLWKLEQPKP